MPDVENAPRVADPRSERSAAALTEAMTRLARTVPLTELTITRLVKEAAVTRPTFYQHFSGIPDLARTAALADLDRAVPQSHVPGCPMTTTAEVEAYVTGQVRPALAHLMENRAFYLNVLGNGASVELFDGIIHLLTGKMLPDTFEAATAPDSSATGDVMEVVAGGIMWLVIGWLRDGTGEEPEAMALRVGHSIALLLGPERRAG